jgi:Uma2 family endonuclease
VATRTKLTYEDYEAFPDDGNRYEIIDGEVFVSPSPFEPHQIAVGEIYAAILFHIRKRKLGRVYTAPFEIVLGPYDVFQPDVLYIARERLSIVDARGRVRGAPDLCVEVLSASTRNVDRTVKFQQYARFGIAEYWIVDTDLRTVEVYALEDGAYTLVVNAHGQDRVASRVLPTLALQAFEVFTPPV